MKAKLSWLGIALLGASALAPAQETAPPKPRRAVVTFDGKLEAMPRLEPADFEIELEGAKLAPARLSQPGEIPTVLAIVLQDNQVLEFATQLDSLKQFILSQPPNTYVGVYYFSSGSIQTAIQFNSDLKKVAESLRAPRGQRDLAPPTPYDLVARLASYMDSLPDARKEILLFSEGSDATVGDATAGQNRNLNAAAKAATDAGIPVFVLYSDAFPPTSRTTGDAPSQSGTIPGRGTAGQQTTSTYDPTQSSAPSTQQQLFGRSGGESFESDSPYRPPAQYNISYLNYLAERTGGKVFSAGRVPPDIKPYLDEFQRLLNQQVVLEFQGTQPLKKVKLNRKIGGAKVLAPKR
jgi:hypothetical protein